MWNPVFGGEIVQLREEIIPLSTLDIAHGLQHPPDANGIKARLALDFSSCVKAISYPLRHSRIVASRWKEALLREGFSDLVGPEVLSYSDFIAGDALVDGHDVLPMNLAVSLNQLDIFLDDDVFPVLDWTAMSACEDREHHGQMGFAGLLVRRRGSAELRRIACSRGGCSASGWRAFAAPTAPRRAARPLPAPQRAAVARVGCATACSPARTTAGRYDGDGRVVAFRRRRRGRSADHCLAPYPVERAGRLRLRATQPRRAGRYRAVRDAALRRARLDAPAAAEPLREHRHELRRELHRHPAHRVRASRHLPVDAAASASRRP